MFLKETRASTNRVLWSARRAIITAAQASPLFSRGSVSLEQNAFGQPPWRSALYLFYIVAPSTGRVLCFVVRSQGDNHGQAAILWLAG